MVTYLPISSPFIRFASRYVDEAFGMAAGWNFFVFEAAMVPFEITACSMIINYWSDAVPVAAIIVIVLVLFVCVSSSAVVTLAVSPILIRDILDSSTSLRFSGTGKQSSGSP
ncbi:general amino acid permease agp2 [Aspergillus melleus]|uniref:general amino acid permease agp2 n=1 Tax=Aspergillus melleus TaxID=138277 RepID=UPI001E8DC570|nr:general amino acid permease agp2 [Aspergillus melleus]KAH8428853.1 general amino acid permease agp2 [Aspergillus melleus]